MGNNGGSPTCWVPQDNLAHRVRWMRQHLGLSQRDAAGKCGLTFGDWQGLEDGRMVRDEPRKIQQISDALGVDRFWLEFGVVRDRVEIRRRSSRLR